MVAKVNIDLYHYSILRDLATRTWKLMKRTRLLQGAPTIETKAPRPLKYHLGVGCIDLVSVMHLDRWPDRVRF